MVDAWGYRAVSVNVYINQKKLTSLEQQNYYEVHEGAVKSYKNYVRLRLTKKEYFKTLTGQKGRDADDWVSDGNKLHCR